MGNILLPYQGFLKVSEYSPEGDLLQVVGAADPERYPDGQPNTLIYPGRQYLGTLMTSAASGGFIYMCVGASATPAIDIADDDRLGGTAGAPSTAHEYIGNASRKQLMSVLNAGQPLMNYAADWVADTATIDSITYYAKAEGTVTYELGDGNDGAGAGNPFQRWGVNTIGTLPTTVTGYSGIMLNEIIAPAPIYKHSMNIIVANITFRI